jgi:hypothetical protein
MCDEGKNRYDDGPRHIRIISYAITSVKNIFNFVRLHCSHHIIQSLFLKSTVNLRSY